MPDAFDKLPVPDAIREGLRDLLRDLQTMAGKQLASVVVYGGLARGRYYAGRSDINLLIVLHDAGIDTLAAIGPPLQAAWRAWRVEPFLLTQAEIEPAAAAFPTKFLDIQTYHVTLFGDDPFDKLRISREHVRLRIEQGMRNLSLRMRRRFLGITNDSTELTDALRQLARPLAVELASLLSLSGKSVPAGAHTVEIMQAASKAFDLDSETLDRIADLRVEPGVPGPQIEAKVLYGRTLATLAKAIEVVFHYKESPQ